MRAICCAILAFYFLIHARISVDTRKGVEQPAIIGLLMVLSWMFAGFAVIGCALGV